MSRTANTPRTVIYAGSGCSAKAPLAHDVALRPAHGGVTKMACCAGGSRP